MPFALALSTALAACDFEKVVELDAPPYTPRLVVGAFPAADSVFTVQVGRSVSAFEPGSFYGDELLVPDADVEVYGEDGALLERLRYVPYELDSGRGYYRSARGLTAEAGRRYTLRVEAPGLPPAEATTRVPEAIPFSVRFDGMTTTDPIYSAQRARLAVVFTDPPGDQTYALSVTGTYRDGDGSLRSFSNSFASTDPLLKREFREIDAAVTSTSTSTPAASATTSGRISATGS